mmetsp:Transcript_66121/g.141504  ORF Transcript_66121/g.141504 Transcript_66121/m.141504 type:complete len:241 (-) Transcript_66121:230-952(-)
MPPESSIRKIKSSVSLALLSIGSCNRQHYDNPPLSPLGLCKGSHLCGLSWRCHKVNESCCPGATSGCGCEGPLKRADAPAGARRSTCAVASPTGGAAPAALLQSKNGTRAVVLSGTAGLKPSPAEGVPDEFQASEGHAPMSPTMRAPPSPCFLSSRAARPAAKPPFAEMPQAPRVGGKWPLLGPLRAQGAGTVVGPQLPPPGVAAEKVPLLRQSREGQAPMSPGKRPPPPLPVPPLLALP